MKTIKDIRRSLARSEAILRRIHGSRNYDIALAWAEVGRTADRMRWPFKPTRPFDQERDL